MKSLSNILTVCLFSLLIIFLSVGTTVEHCFHQGSVKIATVEEDCCCHEDHPGFNTLCMEYMQVKLAPTTETHTLHLDRPLLFATPIMIGWIRTILLNHLRPHSLGRRASIPHAPPRAVLARLCTFLL